jgi:hypothetical protein
VAAKPVQLTSVQPRSAISTPVKDVPIPRRLSRFIAQPEEFEFIPTSRYELNDPFQPTPVAPPAKRSRKKRPG